MKHVIALTALLFLTVSSLAAPRRRTVVMPPPSLPNVAGTWLLEVTTSGGIAPSMRKSIVLRSSGGAYVLNHLGQPICNARMTASELQRIGDLVAATHPEKWAGSYVLPSNPEGCCDQIRTTLKLTRADQAGRPIAYETFWFDDHLALPIDLASLHDFAYGAAGPRARFEASCEDGEWSVEITEEGGFAYRFQRIVADSSGVVVIQPNAKPATCRFGLDEDEVQRLGDLVRRTDAGAWSASYARAENPSGCCDMIHTAVRLTRTELGPNNAPQQATYTTHWYSDHPVLPADLAEVHARFFGNTLDPTALFQRFGPRCGPTF